MYCIRPAKFISTFHTQCYFKVLYIKKGFLIVIDINNRCIRKKITIIYLKCIKKL